MAEVTEPTTETETVSAFVEAVLAPLGDDDPCGEDVTYDDDFQKLKTQINEIGAASGGAEYETIVELARNILTEKSKDLRAAGYLVIGEARTNGIGGVAEAMQALDGMLQNHWDGLYPAKRRMRARGNALQFISERLGDWLDQTTLEPDDREDVETVRDCLKAVQDFCLEAMGEHAPALSGLLKKVEKELRALPDPEPEPEPESETEEDGTADTDDESTAEPAKKKKTSSASTAKPPPTEIDSASDATKAVTQAAAYQRAAEPSNPLCYRLLRAVRWGVLRAAPPNDGGATRVEPPREQRRTYLKNLLEQEDYETLVEEAEASFQAGPFHFWLDLQRLTVTALGALGKPYRDARDAVRDELALLVRRVPGLPRLAYSDGTPFADPLTADWIESEVLPALGGGGGGASAIAADAALPVTEQYEEARQQFSDGDLAAALDHLKQGASQDASQRETFYRRLYVATLCLKGGQPAVAVPMLEQLDDDIERHALATWNPPLALEVWTTLCQGYDTLLLNASNAEKQRLREAGDHVFAKVCRLDAGRALDVAGKRRR